MIKLWIFLIKTDVVGESWIFTQFKATMSDLDIAEISGAAKLSFGANYLAPEQLAGK